MYPGLDYHENYVEEASCFMLGSKSNTGKPLHLPSPLASFRLCKDSNNSTSFLASCVFWHLSFFLSFSNKKVLRGILFYVSFIPCLGFSIEQEQNVQFQFLVMSNSAPSYWMGTWLIRFQHYYKSFERLQKNFFQRAAVEYCNVLP